MDRSKQIEITRELLSHIAAGTTARAAAVETNSADAYASPEILRLELERIFREYPLVGGLSGDIPEAGCFVTQELAGVPLMLVRDRSGRARAFLNACRHRGTRLVREASGRRLRFSCPFHAWTYGVQGELVGVPHADSFGQLNHVGLGLISLPVVEKYGIIWLKVRPGEEFDIDEALCGLGEELDGWRLGTHVSVDTRSLHRRMNWKLANDTFGETYHFEFLHRKTLNANYYSNVTAYETFGRNHRMVFAARTIEDLRNRPESEWQLRAHSTIAYYLFPNAQLLISPRSVELYKILPDDNQPDRSLIHQSVYLDRKPETEDEEANRQRTLDILETVIVGEDFAVAETAQAALSSGLLPGVRYGRNEPALHHYHAAFREALRCPPLLDTPDIHGDASSKPAEERAGQ